MEVELNVSFKQENLKREFINNFGEDNWNELEILKPLQEAVDLVCKEYLGIESIPVVFEKLDGDVSRYDFKLQAIILNNKYINDYVELLDSCFHELEHHWQRIYIANNDTPKAKRWKEEFKHYNRLDVTQEIEIDAYAFAQVILSCEFGIIKKHPNEELQYLIEDYINSRKILKDD